MLQRQREEGLTRLRSTAIWFFGVQREAVSAYSQAPRQTTTDRKRKENVEINMNEFFAHELLITNSIYHYFNGFRYTTTDLTMGWSPSLIYSKLCVGILCVNILQLCISLI